jgi:Phage tail sheath protein FI
MPIRHGIFVSEQASGVSTPVVADVGVPFVIGLAPIQAAINPQEVGRPILCTSYDEFENQFGYSDNWDDYNLCEFAYSHFKLYGRSPAIFCNLLAPSTMNTSVAASDIAVSNHRVLLPVEALDDENLVVKVKSGGGTAYAKDVDYSVFYSGENLVIELLADSTHYSETELNVAYKKVTPSSVGASAVATGLEKIELCMSTLGIIPDLICAPGFSKIASVAAVMATKAAGINGVFKAKALIDIDSASGGATVYSDVGTVKASNNLTDENEILCWPCVKLGDKQFYMSTALAGLIATVDAGNGAPFESPSNKSLKMDGLVLESGTEVILTKAQADTLNLSYGVVTALNFLSSGWVCWGNYAACYPASTDVKDYFIPVSRMFDWVSNTLVRSFWSKLDTPMNRRLIDTILDSANIWLNGLVGQGYLLGGRAEMIEAENPVTNLMQGIMKIHLYITPPSPAQEIDFTLEYDASYVEAAFA